MVYPDAIRGRIDKLYAADKAEGRINTPQRVGRASGSRYLATKAIQQGLGESPLGRGLYQGSLDNDMDYSNDTSPAENHGHRMEHFNLFFQPLSPSDSEIHRTQIQTPSSIRLIKHD